MPKSKRGRKPIKKCLSCKRLKIKCDLRKPCEYCKYRGKDCIYEAEEVQSSSVPSPVSPDEQLQIVPSYDPISQLILTQLSSQLSMTQQELQILKFFEQRANYSFFYNNQSFADAFQTEIRPFYQDKISTVRYTLLASSAIIQLNYLQTESYEGALTKSEELFDIGVSYFQKSLKLQQRLVELVDNLDNDSNSNSNSDHVIKVDQEHTIKQLLASCLLQLGYFMVNTPKVMPLLSLDPNQFDLIKLVGSHKFIRSKYLPKVAGSKFSLLHPSTQTVPSHLKHDYYLTESLRKDLHDIDKTSWEDDLEDSYKVQEVLEQTIDLLEASISRVIQQRFPFPIFGFVVLLSDEFKLYLHQGNEFALRILFVYAVLCSMGKFCFRRYDNIFLNYACWYKKRQVNNALGKFEYLMDEKLYYLAMETEFQIDSNNIGDFNPIVEAEAFENPDS